MASKSNAPFSNVISFPTAVMSLAAVSTSVIYQAAHDNLTKYQDELGFDQEINRRIDVMPQPRSYQIYLSDTPYYHYVSRSVRRIFLCGTVAALLKIT
jgi:hypothetical protein